MTFWHKWRSRSWKVNMKAFSFSSSPWTCWPVMFQAVRKPGLFVPDPKGAKCKDSQISRRRHRWRRRTKSQIQIQAPSNAPRDEILLQGESSLLILFSPQSDWQVLPVWIEALKFFKPLLCVKKQTKNNNLRCLIVSLERRHLEMILSHTSAPPSRAHFEPHRPTSDEVPYSIFIILKSPLAWLGGYNLWIF